MARLPTPSLTRPQKKTHFSGQGVRDTVPLNCENSPHKGNRGEKETPKSTPSSLRLLHPPVVAAVTLGKAKEHGYILGILLNILGLSEAPLCSPSLPPARANSEPGSSGKANCKGSHHTRETIK